MSAGGKRLQLSRGAAVLVVLGGGALLLLSALPLWASAPVAVTLDAVAAAEVSGTDAEPVVPSAALVILAAGLAIGLAGRLARVLAALAVAGCGALAVVMTILFLRSPEPAVLAEAGNVSAVAELSGPVGVSVWPVVSVVIATVLTLLGLLLPWVMGTWARVGQRYERGARPVPGGTRQHVADWDALSRGEDPSEAEDR
ncbi:MAG TPA: Trp biosynthesis-associated membrane protein [Candidatus Ruania gallistercoris]|uniref:Trp biosynthesis-associated membrane protein n=1 Tax=Candidatus Ruania gallistercoris TaxID=2838746 RepID=A0A9D2EFL7_9MICO|nr:Trp biosynthesis-associated membrane protein [Candidatus Ruania gallistercoris]